MRLKSMTIVLISCVCLSFSSFASDFESSLKEFGIQSESELEEVSVLYDILKDYGITDTDELEDALYSYFYFDDAINEERLSDTQEKVLEEIESDNYSYGYYDGLYKGRMDVFTWIFFIAFILLIMYGSGFLEHFR